MENEHGMSLLAERSWSDMDYDLLVQIFMILNIMDIVSNVSRVCRSWRAACHSRLLWNTMDLAALTPVITNPQELYTWMDQRPSRRLMGKLNDALFFSGNNVARLIFHFYAFVMDEHLIVAAESCTNLKQLVLPAWNQISNKGFFKAIRKLTSLESLTLPSLYCPPVILEAVGLNCKRLTELKLMCAFDNELSSALILHLPKIKFLSLRSTMVHRNALQHILEGLEDLEVVNISHSILVNMPPPEGSKGVYMEPDAEIMTIASRLKKFLFCQKAGCTMCQNVYADGGRPRWHDYDQSFWRGDEVNSLAV